MSYVQEIARDALKTAHDDLAKARRGLLLAAGVLALIHLLSVYPYLETSRKITDVEAAMAANDAQLARLEPAIDQLKTASDTVGLALNDLLFNVTADMISDFADLRNRIAWAGRGEDTGLPPPLPPAPSFPSPDPSTQMLQMQQVSPVQQMPPISPVTPNAPFDQSQMSGNFISPAAVPDDLQPLLEAVAAEEPGAMERLTDYARENIVAKAYRRAEREWSERIRPNYLDTLDTFERKTLAAANGTPQEMSETASLLRTTASEIAQARKDIGEIEITSDASVDAALGTDWWRTVEGKGAYADAIADSIQSRMMSIAETASAPAEAIRTSIRLQEDLRNRLADRQEVLEQQFDEQRKQLVSLSGVTSAIPIDLASFIALFPLVVGLVLGFMMMRVAQARQTGARAAADLANATSEDPGTRRWLARRLLGGGTPLALLATAAIAAGSIAWIGLAVLQVGNASVDAPLSPQVSGLLAVLVIVAAAFLDMAAIRRLGTFARR